PVECLGTCRLSRGSAVRQPGYIAALEVRARRESRTRPQDLPIRPDQSRGTASSSPLACPAHSWTKRCLWRVQSGGPQVATDALRYGPMKMNIEIDESDPAQVANELVRML